MTLNEYNGSDDNAKTPTTRSNAKEDQWRSAEEDMFIDSEGEPTDHYSNNEDGSGNATSEEERGGQD